MKEQKVFELDLVDELIDMIKLYLKNAAIYFDMSYAKEMSEALYTLSDISDYDEEQTSGCILCILNIFWKARANKLVKDGLISPKLYTYLFIYSAIVPYETKKPLLNPGFSIANSWPI